MASGSESDNDFHHGSPSSQGPAPTPGYGLDRSASNSPDFSRKSPERARKSASRSVRSASGSRSGSGSPASRRSHSTQSNRSRSVDSNRSQSRPKSRSPSAGSDKSGSQRSQSPGSNKSNRSRSASSERSRSSAGSNRSRSQGSARSRSGSKNSNRSRSGSKESRTSRRSGSGSQRSRSGSRRSRSGSRQSRSVSRGSARSRSSSKGSARSRSNSQASNRSRSGSPASNRSKSVESNRSRASKSRSRSGSRGSRSDRSRSRSKSQQNQSHNSKSNSPQLQIDAESDGGSPSSKRKRESSVESVVVRKKSKVIDTDSEEEIETVVEAKEPTEEQSRVALFGDADDISSEEEAEDKTDRRSERDSGDERERQSGSDNENEAHPVIEDDEEKEPEPEPIPETRIDVQIPKISCDLGRDIHFVKLPNFLSVETRPFDQETYEDEIDEEETLDEEGRARLKLKVENTIRWREDIDKEGNTIKESNARFVRWSDGSLSLHLGSEIFDVYKQPLQGDHNHLFIRQGTGLQGQAVFRTKLSFRPHSTESFTHRKMTLSLADRSQKVSGIKIISQVGVDPDKDRKMLLKEEEQKLRQPVRTTKPRKRSEGGTRTHHRESFREEEGSDEEGTISLNAIKNKYKSGVSTAAQKGGAIYSTDEDESDFEARRNRKTDKAKVLQDSESGESD